MLKDHDTAVAVARAAAEGSGLPVTVKLRSGEKKGDTSGVELAHRLVAEAGVAGITFHPRSAQVHHKGEPDLDLARELVASLPAPVILSGGMNEPAWIVDAWEHTGAEAVMLARGALGNPWLFARMLGARDGDPTPGEVVDELAWVMDRAVEHLGDERAGRYLRKFYPWYVERLGEAPGPQKALQAALQQTSTVEEARAVLSGVDGVSRPLQPA
jgi:tRNA-dihydrouridine synthase